jgi:RHS repeat-associated protein
LTPISSSLTTGTIGIRTNGAVAQFAPHKAFFAPNPNTAGAVQLTIPDRSGEVLLKSHLVGIGFWDSISGESVLFATLQDSVGEISGSSVRYTNALDGTDAEINYTYAWDSFDQTIVLRKKIPEPSAFNMTGDPAKIRLVVITEFIDPPEPIRQPGILDLTAKNQHFGIQSEDSIPDETLFFGSMRMAVGKMLLLGNSSVEVPSGKSFMTVNGNHYLLEFCPWLLVKALVDSLPAGSLHASIKARGDLNSLIAQLPRPKAVDSRSPKMRLVRNSSRTADLAASKFPDSRPGVVLDYLLVSSHLIDVNLSGAIPEKLGVAAVGRLTNDVWITWLSSYSSLANLLWSDQLSSGVGLAISGISGGWGNGVNDPMYNSYLYGGSGGSLTLTLTNMPTNVFNFYLYGHAGRDVANSSFKLLRASNQIAYKGTTLWGNTWNSTNWEPGLQYQVFKNIAITNQTIQFQIPAGGDGLPYVNGLQIVESAAVPPPPTNITNLFNVNFGGPSTNKVGLAAVGLATNDYWNGYYNSSNLSGSIVGLTNAGGTTSTVGLTVLNSPGIGSWNGGGNGDGMYTSFVYATNGGNVTLLLTNLTTGNYDFYLFGHGNTNDANTIFQLWSGGRDWDVRGTTIWGSGYSNSTAWDESQQYIVYHDIPVDSNQVVTIVAGHDPYGSANLNGMQVVYKGSYDTNSDGLPDVWKWYYFVGTNTSGLVDSDNDKLSNFREFQLGTNPTKTDTDGNGVSDSNDSERVWIEDYTPVRGLENDASAVSPSWSGAFSENWGWTGHFVGWNGSGGVNAYSFYSTSPCHCFHVSDIHSGIHQHWFDKSDVNMMVNTGEVLITYVNIDPTNVPSEIMLQWYTTETNGLDSWEHRAYWGSNAISWGTNNTPSCWYVTNLPSAGSWTRLEVPASAVNLEGRVIQGMAFTLYNGRAAFDHAGKFIPDMDGNSLTDTWEKYYFGSIGQDSNGDPDKDGLSNFQEFQNGTNPTNCNPPQIWGQPQNTCGYQGGTAYFIVTPTGSVLTNYHFQWRLGGTNIASATNSSLVIPSVQSTNLGNYTVVITNVCGSITSSVATLTFCPPPYVQITAPTNTSTFTAPAFVTIQAMATNTDSSVTNVEFYRGNLYLLGHATASPYSYTWTAAAGLYSLTAVAYDSHGLISTSSRVTITVGSACSYTNNTYSSNNAFGNGFIMNLNYTNSFGRLQLNSQTTPFHFINVACGQDGTLVRVDTDTGTPVGEYFTAPTNKASYPGHVAVDRYGNAWVANWDELGCGLNDGSGLGSITRIGLVIGGTRGDIQTNQFGVVTNFVVNTNTGQYLKPPFIYSTAIDRNGDGYIKTSRTTNNVLSWPTNSVGGGLGSVLNADDECIINYVRVPAQLASTLAVDANNDVWVGGYCVDGEPCSGVSVCGTKVHVKVNGITGAVVPGTGIQFTNDPVGPFYGGFEGIIGQNGFLWSSGGVNDPGASSGNRSLVMFDPVAQTNIIFANTDGNYGMDIDPLTGNVWVAGYDSSNVVVYSKTGTRLASYSHGDTFGSGVAIDNNGNVWISHGPFYGATNLARMHTDGTSLTLFDLRTNTCANVTQGREVCFDAAGKIWTLCARSPHVLRVNPITGQVEKCLQIGTSHQARGDLTGYKLLANTAPSGVWSVIYTNGATNQAWGTLTWTASTTDTNQIRVEVRAANSYGQLSTNSFQLTYDSVPLNNVVGQLLEIRVTLAKPTLASTNPWLHDLTLDCSPPATAPIVKILSPTNNQPFVFSPTNILITATNLGSAITNMAFYVGSNQIGQTTNLPYQYLWTNATMSTNTITIKATNSAGLWASDTVTNIVINGMPVITNNTPTNLHEFVQGSNVALTNTAWDPDMNGYITNVTFYTWSNSIVVPLAGNVISNNLKYSVMWTNPTVGFHSYYAIATDNRGASSASQITIFKINPTNTPPYVWISYPTNNEIFRAGADITIKASVTPGSGTVTNVEFYVNGQLLGNDPETPYSITVCCWKPGSYTNIARATDSRGSVAVSTNVLFVVADKESMLGQGRWDSRYAQLAYQITYFDPGYPFFHDASRTISSISIGSDGTAYMLVAEDRSCYWPLAVQVNGTNQSVYLMGTDNCERIGSNILWTAINAKGTNIYAALTGTTQTGSNPAIPVSQVYKWSPIDGPPPAASPSLPVKGSWSKIGTDLTDGIVLAIEELNGELYIGGGFRSVFNGTSWNTNIQYVSKLNAANNIWESVSSNNLDAMVYSLAVMGGKLYAGGCFACAGSDTNLNGIARLDGVHWRSLGNGLKGDSDWAIGIQSDVLTNRAVVRSMSVCRDNLFVGGHFKKAGDVSGAYGVAVWNERKGWSTPGGVGLRGYGLPYLSDVWDFRALGIDMTGDSVPAVFVIKAHGDDLFIGGNFTHIIYGGTNELVAHHIAKATWNEETQAWTWTSLDKGSVYPDPEYPYGYVSYEVFGIDVRNGSADGAKDVFVGGDIDYLGENPLVESVNQALWRGGYPPSVQPYVSITNPVNLTIFTNNSPSFSIPIRAIAGTNINFVEFFVDGISIGTGTLDGQRYTNQWPTGGWSGPTNGVHILTATAEDMDGLRTASKAIVFNVKGTNALAFDDAFTLIENGPAVSLPVLTNDAAGTRLSQIVQLDNSLGHAAMSYDHTYISYTPFAKSHGTERIIYSVTNASGLSDSAWVNINIRARPVVEITLPFEGDRFGTTTNVNIRGIVRDYDGVVTNVALWLGGAKIATQATNSNFSFNWSNNVPGYYTFSVVATDNEGLTNEIPVATQWDGEGSRRTVVITNSSPSTHGPVALISNLSNTPHQEDGLGWTDLAIVREGFFDLQGSALDLDGDLVSYAVLLYRTEDLEQGDNVDEAIRNFEPLANLTPSSLNPQGFHNQAVTNGGLGTLDFTRFPNGTYYLVLRVRGGTDETNAFVQFRLESQLKIGQFSFTEQDLVIPVNGIPLTVMRTYNSLNPRSADFGYSWTYAINGMDVQLNEHRQNVTIGTDTAPFADDEEDANGLPKVLSIRTGGGRDVTLNLPDGRRTTFAFTPRVSPYECKAYAEWKPPSDAHATLTSLDTYRDISLIPTRPPVWEQGGDNSTYENYDISGWILDTLDGTKYYIRRPDPDTGDLGPNNVTYQISPGSNINVQVYGPPKLTSIVQRSGDEIRINGNGIAHYAHGTNLTRSTFFKRDQVGRITEIRDPISSSNGLPVVRYVYNQDTGNLIQVHRLTDRVAGLFTTNKYHYENPNFPHYITSIEDPRGVPLARNEYDDSGRLTAVVDADGNRTQFYHNTSNPNNRIEVVVDRLGRTNSHAYDAHGNVTATTNAMHEYTLMSYDTNNDNMLSTTDSLGHTTRFGYNDDGARTMVVNALNRTNYSMYDDQGNLIGTKDPLGNWTTNLFDEIGNLTNTIQKRADGLTVGQSFSRYVGGFLAQTLDANQNTNATFTYDGFGNLSSMTNDKGFIRSFGYDANGNQTNTTYTWTGPGGPINVTSRTECDAQGRVTLTVDVLGNTNRTFYTSLGKVDYTVDKLGNTNRYFYDARGNVIQNTGPDNLSVRSVYNEDGKPVYTSDRNGITGARMDYDLAGRVTNTVRLTNITITISAIGDGVWSSSLASAGTPYSTNSTKYLENGWVEWRKGPDGQKTSYTYYDDGQIKTVTDTLTNEMYYEYDEAGRQKLVADALNHTNQFVFDAVGRNIKTIFADNTFITNIFNLSGRQVGTVDQANVLMSNIFNISGELTGVVVPSVPDPEGGTNAQPTWTYGFDQYGQQITMTDAKGRVTTNMFDQFGREIGWRLPTSGETNYIVYDAFGRITNRFDFKKQLQISRYDRFGRVATNFWFAFGASYPSNSTEYYYNVLGQLTNIIERVSTNASASYVATVGFPRKYYARVSQWRTVWNYGVEHVSAPAGILLTVFAFFALPRDARRLLIQFYLRGGWRLSQIPLQNVRRLYLPSLWNRAVSLLLIVALFASDRNLEKLWTARADCSVPPANNSNENTRYTYFTYDFDGHLTQANYPEGAINYEYDLGTGRHTGTCTTNSYVQYGYDQLGRLKTVQVIKRNGTNLVNPELTTYDYTKVGNRWKVTLPNGVVTEYLYDSLNRLTNLTQKLGGTNLLASYSYQLHPTGRRTNAVEILKTEDSGVPWITNTLSWAYDQMYRLTNETSISSFGAANFTNRYAYDLVGNRFSRVHIVSAGTSTTTNLFNENDRLLKEVTWQGSSMTESNAYSYDANGSLVSKAHTASGSTSSVTYSYDLKNKLSSFSGGSSTGTFVYNHQGIRVRSTIDSNTTLYLIDPYNHTGYQQILEELTARGVPATRSYVIGDDVLGQAVGSTVSWLLYDGHGSTRQLSSTLGAVTSRYNFEAYGPRLDSSTSVTNENTNNSVTSLLYCGEHYDAKLEMYNLRARYYDPNNGRFNSMDAFRGNNGDPQSLHKYEYANCDPANRLDPSGRMSLGWTIALCIAVFVVVFIAAHYFKLVAANWGVRGGWYRPFTRAADDMLSELPWGLKIYPDDYNGLSDPSIESPGTIVNQYRDVINGQTLVPPELLASVLLAELRHYNIGDTLGDRSNGGRNHSVGIAQIKAETIRQHGYLDPKWTDDDIREALWAPKSAIKLLALEIHYFAQTAGVDLNKNWASANEEARENIVAGMTSAKDTDKYEYGGNSAFGVDYGVTSYRYIKNHDLLGPDDVDEDN